LSSRKKLPSIPIQL